MLTGYQFCFRDISVNRFFKKKEYQLPPSLLVEQLAVIWDGTQKTNKAVLC